MKARPDIVVISWLNQSEKANRYSQLEALEILRAVELNDTADWYVFVEPEVPTHYVLTHEEAILAAAFAYESLGQ